ncbi:MAG: hypothetical protein AAB461_01455 [Patescibacteria group bacterium]
MPNFENQKVSSEQIKPLEKNSEDLYLDALEKKRDTLLSFRTMNDFRKGKRPEEMAPEEIEKYKLLKEDWRLNKDKSMSVWDDLSEDYQQELVTMTRLYDVQAKLTLLKLKNKSKLETGESTTTEIPTDEPAATENPKIEIEEKQKLSAESTEKSEDTGEELEERKEAEADAKRRDGITNRIDEIDKLLTGKYGTSTFVIGRESLKEEIRALENEKASLENELGSPEGKVGKIWGNRIKNVFKERREQIETKSPVVSEVEPEGSRQWTALGWLAERGKGILSAGIWEVRQAWRFQRGTKLSAKHLEEGSKFIQVEDEAEADKIYNEIHDLMKENNITTVTAPEFMDIAQKVTAEKAAVNNARIDLIVEATVKNLKERLVKYRGQGTDETVLTPENLKLVEEDLRTQLGKMRSGATLKDVNNFAKVMRDNMDKKWWLRYVYAPLEASLLGYLAYSYLPWSSWLRGGNMITGGEDINLPAEEAGQRYMDNNLWEESREQLKEIGIDNPTNTEIQSVDSAAAQENNVRVVNPDTDQTIWPETADGQTKDINMMKGLIKWGAAHKAALAIKAARVAAGMF